MTKNNYKASFPEEDKIRFKNFINKERMQMITYADIECILKPVEDLCTTNNGRPYQQHEAHSVGYYLHTDFDKLRI